MDEKKIASARTETNPILLKNFYRTYYSEKYRTVKIVTLIIAVILFLAAAALYYNGFGLIYPFILVWAGAVMIIYPRNAYRKPYKSMKNTRTVTHFDFYPDSMTERSGSGTETFRYGDIYRVIETNQYFYIFHSPDTASVVEKSNISYGSADEVREIFKAKTKYTRKK